MAIWYSPSYPAYAEGQIAGRMRTKAKGFTVRRIGETRYREDPQYRKGGHAALWKGGGAVTIHFELVLVHSLIGRTPIRQGVCTHIRMGLSQSHQWSAYSGLFVPSEVAH